MTADEKRAPWGELLVEIEEDLNHHLLALQRIRNLLIQLSDVYAKDYKKHRKLTLDREKVVALSKEVRTLRKKVRRLKKLKAEL